MELMRKLSVVVLYLQLILILSSIQCAHGTITLRNNGYEGIVIAISDQVKETTYPDLIDKLKTHFTAASSYLYTATRQRAYFKNITILIPESWQAPSLPATSESFNTADVRIDYYPDDRTAVRARTVGLSKCGGFGQYILISPQRLYKLAWSPARMIVHEWGHFRFGLYDEYAYTADEVFYRDIDGDMIATRCNAQLPGAILDKTSKQSCSFPYGSNCVFFPQNPSVPSASIMFNQNIPAVVHFCDSDNSKPATAHNKLPNHRHNRLCESKSAWDVMNLGVDFNDVNLPTVINDTTPNFIIVKPQKSKTVLVLDVSGSMGGTPLLQLQQAATNYLLNVVQNGSFVGIVTFESTASTRSALLQINSDVERNALVNLLPKKAGGSTSIGAGIRLGIKELKQNMNGPSGGTLIVLTDGKENQAPYIRNVKQEVLDNKVTVQGISFGNLASVNLEALAYETGGFSFFVPNDDTARLTNAFATIAEQDNRGKIATIVQLYSKQITLTRGQNFSKVISLDNELAVALDFTFMWITNNVIYTVTTPNGDVYNSTTPEFQAKIDRKLSQFKFGSDLAKTGNWKFMVLYPKNAASAVAKITITVTSRSLPLSTDDALKLPVSISARVAESIIKFPNPAFITVNVQKGYLAVLKAVVVITVITPRKKSIVIRANDEGAGADRIKNDGVYSAYFTQFDGNSRYSVEAQVTSLSNTTFINFNYVIGVGNLQDGDQFVVNGSETVGSVVNKPNHYLEAFSRVSSGSLMDVSNFRAGVDGIPPARVHSLTLTKIDNVNKTVTFTFFAPGDDMDFGRAAYYEFRYSSNYTNFLNNYADGILVEEDQVIGINKTLTSPRIAGSDETFTILMDNTTSPFQTTYIFAMRTYDEAGLASSVSNYVQVRFIRPPSGLSGGAVAAIIIGIIVICVILAVIVWRYRRGQCSGGSQQQGRSSSSDVEKGKTTAKTSSTSSSNVQTKQSALNSVTKQGTSTAVATQITKTTTKTTTKTQTRTAVST